MMVDRLVLHVIRISAFIEALVDQHEILMCRGYLEGIAFVFALPLDVGRRLSRLRMLLGFACWPMICVNISWISFALPYV